MRRCVRAAIIACILGHTGGAMAQQPAGAARFEGTCALSGKQYATLIESYESGAWAAVQREGRDVVKSCTFKTSLAIDLATDYVSLTLIGHGLDGRPEELAILLHSPDPEPYRMTLPGLRDGDARHFYELFVAPGQGYQFNSRYVVERVADPVSAQAAAFLKKAIDIGALAGGFSGPVEAARLKPPEQMPATCYRVAVPFERASITAEHLVTGPDIKKDKPLETKQKYQNTPLRRWTFGLLTGAIAASKATDRAKVESSLLSADPLPTTLSMAIVNIHPGGYDEGLPRMSGRERFRLFTGTVLTPGFGLGAGVGLGIVRGFSINAGGAVFLTRRLEEGDSFGQLPKDPDRPTRPGVGSAVFVGFSYAFD